MTLRLKRRASRVFSMNEGRKTQIVLLDERRLDIIIQPKLYSNDLLDLVASHFKLKEKHYFGLGFYDETNHFNWLQGEKRVLEHDFPKKTGLLVLHFSIRFYVDTIGLLRDTQTVELFYLNTRQALFRGQIECDTETVFELAAHVLQATNGDFVSEEETREELKKLPVIPTSSLKEHPSIAYCEDRVISYYEKLNGTTRGHAIVNYMTIVEKLPTYGIHYYDVKDKKDIPWWLGISPKGIAVYDKNDKTTPRKLFTWKTLENLYYRDKKFSIEVHGPKRIIHTLSSFNPYEDAVREPVEWRDDLSTAISDPSTQVSVSRRTFGASNVDVHAWFASTPQLTKCIWSMAVAQHQFYLDRKQSKGQLPAARSMSEIAEELCRSTTSLPGSLGSDISRSPSSHSLPSLCNSRYDLTIEQSDSLKAERDMYQALKARKEALEDALRKKTEELKILCLQEGDLTGEVPKDMPLAHGEPVPVFRKRVGTAFSLSHAKDINNLSSDLSKLELEVELQGKITAAAEKLASDKTVSKYVRKQRKQCYTKALGKLKEMEKKLREMRKQVGKTSSSQHQTGMAHDGMYHVIAPRCNSDLDLLSLGFVHATRGHWQDDSCGNSTHSGDSSVTTDYRDSSCGYSPSMSSVFSHASKVYSDGCADDVCSLSESTSPSSGRSMRDDTSSGFYSLESRSPSKTPSVFLDEDLSLTLKPDRRKHFIVSRGFQPTRLTEIKSGFTRSRSAGCIQAGSPSRESAMLAVSEYDDDLDDTDSLNDTLGNESLDDSLFKQEERQQSTQVMSRKKVLIRCNKLSRSSSASCNIEQVYKTFEHVYMGKVEEENVGRGRSRTPQVKRSLFDQADVKNPAQVSPGGAAELDKKIQELLNSPENNRPKARSRSFDASLDARVSPIKPGTKLLTKDDLKLENSPAKNIALTARKSFSFFSKKREKAKSNKTDLPNVNGKITCIPSLNGINKPAGLVKRESLHNTYRDFKDKDVDECVGDELAEMAGARSRTLYPKSRSASAVGSYTGDKRNSGRERISSSSSVSNGYVSSCQQGSDSVSSGYVSSCQQGSDSVSNGYVSSCQQGSDSVSNGYVSSCQQGSDSVSNGHVSSCQQGSDSVSNGYVSSCQQGSDSVSNGYVSSCQQGSDSVSNGHVSSCQQGSDSVSNGHVSSCQQGSDSVSNGHVSSCQQGSRPEYMTLRRRSSWHSSSRQNSLTTNSSIVTTV